jgi:hypothetical protein
VPLEAESIFMCERCFSAAEQAGPCPRCRQPRQEFIVGPPGDELRQPPLDRAGQVQCRAPLWWVVTHARYLRQR